MDGLPSPELVLTIVVNLAVLAFAFTFHEFAHAWVATRCGDDTAARHGRLTMNPIRHLDVLGSLLVPLVLMMSGSSALGWARPTPFVARNTSHPRRTSLLVFAAGPCSNLLLFGLSTLLLAILGHVSNSVQLVLRTSVALNLTLAILNAFPLPPLDGFGVVESVSPRSWWRLMGWLHRYGFVVFIVLAMTGVLATLIGLVSLPVLSAVWRITR